MPRFPTDLVLAFTHAVYHLPVRGCAAGLCAAAAAPRLNCYLWFYIPAAAHARCRFTTSVRCHICRVLLYFYCRFWLVSSAASSCCCCAAVLFPAHTPRHIMLRLPHNCGYLTRLLRAHAGLLGSFTCNATAVIRFCAAHSAVPGSSSTPYTPRFRYAY